MVTLIKPLFSGVGVSIYCKHIQGRIKLAITTKNIIAINVLVFARMREAINLGWLFFWFYVKM